MAEIYNDDLSYILYPYRVYKWGYVRRILFTRSDGKKFDFLMHFNGATEEPSNEQLQNMIDFWAAKALIYEEEIIAEDGEII